MGRVMPQIEHVVHLMLENRSFDNLLGWMYQTSAPQHIVGGDTGPFDGLVEGRDKLPYDAVFGGLKEYPIIPLPVTDTRVPAYDPHEEFDGVLNQIFGNQNK